MSPETLKTVITATIAAFGGGLVTFVSTSIIEARKHKRENEMRIRDQERAALESAEVRIRLLDELVKTIAFCDIGGTGSELNEDKLWQFWHGYDEWMTAFNKSEPSLNVKAFMPSQVTEAESQLKRLLLEAWQIISTGQGKERLPELGQNILVERAIIEAILVERYRATYGRLPEDKRDSEAFERVHRGIPPPSGSPSDSGVQS